MQENAITRRTFATVSAAALAAAAASGELFGSGTAQLIADPADNTGNTGTVEYKYGACRFCHQQKCNYKCTLKDGVAVRLEGVKNSYVSNGTLCSRGNSLIPQHYNPYRAKTPLRRTNPERGFDVDPGWEEISWDEATDIVAAHLKECVETDPRTFLFLQGFARTGVVTRTGQMADITGTPNSFETNGPLCAKHFPGSSSFGSFNSMIYDFTTTEYCLNMDRNLGPSTGNNDTKFMSYTMKRGMKIVNCDPRFSPECGYDNAEWLPIKPGGELPFIMALCEVLAIEEEFYDVKFLQWRTNMPYLIATDGDYARGANGKPLIWDATAGAAFEFDDPALTDPALNGTYTIDGVELKTAFEHFKDSVRDITPEFASTYADISPEKIREVAGDLMKYSGICKEDQSLNKTIVVEGIELPLRPVAITTGRGTTSQKNGIHAMVEANNLNMLLGNVGVPGGLNAISHKDCFKSVDADGLVALTSEAVAWHDVPDHKFAYPPNCINLQEFYPFAHSTPYLAMAACANPEKYGIEYTPKMCWTYGGNILVSGGSGEVAAEGLKKIDFQVATSYHIDEPAWFADIVLPEDSNLERYATMGFKAVGFDADDNPVCYNQQQVMQPIVERLYDTRMADDIFAEVMEKAGLLDRFIEVHNEKFGDDCQLPAGVRPTAKQLFDCQIKTAFGTDHGIDEVTPEGFISETYSWDRRYNYAFYPELEHGHYRHRMYFEHMVLTGRKLKEELAAVGLDNVPGWTDSGRYFDYFTAFPEFFEDDYVYNVEGYDMRVINWKTQQFTGLVGGNDNPYLVQVSKDWDPWTYGICINPAKAAELGVKKGDTLVVESPHGKLEGPAILTECFRPDCVGIGGNLGRKSLGLNPIANEGQCYNDLLAIYEDWIDPIAAQIPMTPWARVTKKEA